jgi:hypothetical protein
MIRTSINAGVCGFHTMITARSHDMQMVTLEIAFECEKIRGLAEALKPPIDAYQEIGGGWNGMVLEAARTHLSGWRAGCAVPSGIRTRLFHHRAIGGRRESMTRRVFSVKIHSFEDAFTNTYGGSAC